MATHGIWLSAKDGEQVATDLLALWYALTCPKSDNNYPPPSDEMIRRLREYCEFFYPYNEDGDTGPWPDGPLIRGFPYQRTERP